MMQSNFIESRIYFLLKINVHKELMSNTKTCYDFDSFFFLYLKYNFGSVISFAVQLSTRSMNGFDVFMYVGVKKNVLLILVTYSNEICVELAAILLFKFCVLVVFFFFSTFLIE